MLRGVPNTYPTVSAYVRANFAYWAKRWVVSLLFTGIIVAAFRINRSDHMWAALGAVGIAVAFALLVTAIALTIAGMLHVRGRVTPAWLTQDRGAGASIAAFAVGILLIWALMWLNGM